MRASFVPHLNAGKTITPIDTLIGQVFGFDVSNGSASVTINGRDAKGLSQKITVPSPQTLMEKSPQFLVQ